MRPLNHRFNYYSSDQAFHWQETKSKKKKGRRRAIHQAGRSRDRFSTRMYVPININFADAIFQGNALFWGG